MLYSTNSWTYEFDTILIDLNGMLTVYGSIDDSTQNALLKLKELWYNLILLTWDQRWNAEYFESLWLKIVIAKDSKAKADFAKTCVKENTVAIGNARIDIGMFKEVGLRIATLQSEWIHAWILGYIDIIVPSFVAACQLLIDSDVFAATMKV
jgi:soluble P-type ATPase